MRKMKEKDWELGGWRCSDDNDYFVKDLQFNLLADSGSMYITIIFRCIHIPGTQALLFVYKVMK